MFPLSNPRSRLAVPVALTALLGLALVGTGCLGEPEIDERWTLLEILAAEPGPEQDVMGAGTMPVRMTGQITYRAIRTGFLVAEARYSPVLNARAADLEPEVHDLAGALRVEQVLAQSVTAGRAVKAVTGFDHLIQKVDFEFDAVFPADLFTGSPDSVANRGMFLVLYLAEGDEIELEGGRDSLVVTPFPVEEMEILFTGFALDALDPAAGGGP